MAKYVYAAVFTPDGDGYSIDFPDLEGCYTCGDDLQDGIKMAQDVLSLTLVDYEDNKKKIPAASKLSAVPLNLEAGEFASYIACDTTAYRRLLNSAAVKKTLSIPAWLNEAAMAAGVNFSQTLQDALKTQLGMQ